MDHSAAAGWTLYRTERINNMLFRQNNNSTNTIARERISTWAKLIITIPNPSNIRINSARLEIYNQNKTKLTDKNKP